MPITTDSQVTWIHQVNSTVQEMNSKIFRQLLKHVNSNKTPSDHAHRLTTGLFSLIERETNTGRTNHVVAYTSSGQIQLLNAQLFHDQRNDWYALLDNATTNQPPHDLLMARITQIRDNAKQQLSAGGRNLLLNTADFTKNWVFSKSSSETATRQDVQDGILTIKGEQATWKHYRQLSNDNANLVSIIDNQPVTLSYEAKGDVQLRIFVRLGYTNRSGYNAVSLRQNVTSEWVRYKHTFTVSHADNSADAFSSLAFLIESYSVGTVQVRKVKLERGTVATDWTPAVEDVGVEEDL